MRRGRRRAGALAAVAALCGGCATTPYDYAPYRQHMPRSILVLPPLNESVEVNAPYSYLSTVTRPLAECGYYVFPVAVIDAFLKDNGLPTPGEMHTVSLAKISEVIGADAVLYVTIEDWGQKYLVISSNTVVKARARLVDVATATTLWEGRADAVQGSSGGGDPIAMLVMAVIEQVIDTTTDQAHNVSRLATANMVFNKDHGLLFGSHSPHFATDARGR